MCTSPYPHQIDHFPSCCPEWPSVPPLQWAWNTNSCFAWLPFYPSYLVFLPWVFTYFELFQSRVTWLCKLNSKLNYLSCYVPWNIIFAFTIWNIWLGWNSLIFSRNSIPSHILKQNAISHATEFFFLSSVPLRQSSSLSIKYIRWSPAPFPYITINTDSSLIGKLGKSGAGGVARLANGEWLWGFSLLLGVTNNTMAELWGLREALARAWAKGHHRVCLQTNSLLAYKWLNTNIEYPMEFSNLILDCKLLLNKDWEAHVEHIWREANSYADLLAEKGASQSEREVLYDTCPTPHYFLAMFILGLHGFCLIP